MVLTYSHITLENYKSLYLSKQKLKSEKLKLRKVEDQAWRDFYETQKTDGYQRLEDIIQALHDFDEFYPRSDQQIKFHRAFIIASLPKILKDDFNASLARVLKIFDIDTIRRDVIVCTPRRFGKSYSVALYVAAYLITQPDTTITIYSTGKRASKSLLGLVTKMTSTLLHKRSIKYKVDSENQETFTITLNGTKRTLNSLPSNPKIT
jgi:hypothetical protein